MMVFRSVMTVFRTKRFETVFVRSLLWDIHFSENRKENKTDKAFNMRPVIDIPPKFEILRAAIEW